MATVSVTATVSEKLGRLFPDGSLRLGSLTNARLSHIAHVMVQEMCDTEFAEVDIPLVASQYLYQLPADTMTVLEVGYKLDGEVKPSRRLFLSSMARLQTVAPEWRTMTNSYPTRFIMRSIPGLPLTAGESRSQLMVWPIPSESSGNVVVRYSRCSPYDVSIATATAQDWLIEAAYIPCIKMVLAAKGPRTIFRRHLEAFLSGIDLARQRIYGPTSDPSSALSFFKKGTP